MQQREYYYVLIDRLRIQRRRERREQKYKENQSNSHTTSDINHHWIDTLFRLEKEEESEESN